MCSKNHKNHITLNRTVMTTTKDMLLHNLYTPEA